MNCEELRELLPDYWSGELDEAGKAGMQGHLSTCPRCREEVERLGMVWQKIAAIPEERPSAALRDRFETTLEAYQQGMRQVQRAERRKKLDTWLAGWWPQQPAFQFGFAMAFLAVGLLIGHSISRSTAPNTGSAEIAKLQEEVQSTRQLVTLSMLQQQSAGERLQGVNFSSQIRQPDPPVLDALMHAVNYDQNVNVRLAALDALHKPASTTDIIRKRLVESLKRQDSPLVQIALIDLLVEVREREAREPLRQLAANVEANQAVRTRASWALERIQ
jgi:hypothetical protein